MPRKEILSLLIVISCLAIIIVSVTAYHSEIGVQDQSLSHIETKSERESDSNTNLTDDPFFSVFNQTISISGNGLNEEEKMFTYTDASTGEERNLTAYKIWDDIVYNAEKTTISPKSGKSTQLYQRIRASIYTPKGQLWFAGGGEGWFSNVVFYDFENSEWFGSTAVVTGERDSQGRVLMEPGLPNPRGAQEPKLLFSIADDEKKADIYRIISRSSLLILYEKPVRAALVLTEEETCRTLDIDPLCDFYNFDLFNEELAQKALKIKIVR